LHLEGIEGLEDMLLQFEEIYGLAKTNTFSYLLLKNDQSLEDVILYLLEIFDMWSQLLYSQEEDIKSFNSASIDLTDTLRHFIDVSYKFKHEYQCLDAEAEVQKEGEESLEQTTETSLISVTSAQSYFSEIELDSEVYDELLELEREIEVLSYAASYTEDITVSLINFFDGYTRVLNPLMEFKDLSYSLMVLNQNLSEYKIDENSEMLLILMRGLISDLLEWKRTVLVEQTAEDIHFMDKSFYSNIAQIEMSLLPIDLDDDEGDMEFF
ncbi:MAG: hypothetical protein Q9M34_04790, partial [Sulfurimonas sp.]|nr:hypothetical protein [Sulfurimonas sp.]